MKGAARKASRRLPATVQSHEERQGCGSCRNADALVFLPVASCQTIAALRALLPSPQGEVLFASKHVVAHTYRHSRSRRFHARRVIPACPVELAERPEQTTIQRQL